MLSKPLSSQRTYQIFWRRIWHGEPMFCCATQAPYQWYVSIDKIVSTWSSQRILQEDITDTIISFKTYNREGYVDFVAFLTSRYNLCSWLLENPQRCIESSLMWLVWETDPATWSSWFEGDTLFSTGLRYSFINVVSMREMSIQIVNYTFCSLNEGENYLLYYN